MADDKKDEKQEEKKEETKAKGPDYSDTPEDVPHAQRDVYVWDDEKGWIAPKA